jgi:DNA-binding GntR family transcriptional regulator
MHFAMHPLAPADICSHDHILAALANRDGAAAAEAMRAHILYAKERLLSGL